MTKTEIIFMLLGTAVFLTGLVIYENNFSGYEINTSSYSIESKPSNESIQLDRIERKIDEEQERERLRRMINNKL